MCFSAKASIISYGIGMTASIMLLLSKNKFNKHIGLFCLVFVQMQLAEFFLWSDQKCGLMNHYGSVFTHFNLMLQPLSIFIGAYLYQTMFIPYKYLLVIGIIYFTPILMALYHHFIKRPSFKLCSKGTQNIFGHLNWDWNIDENWIIFKLYKILIPIGILIPWLLLKDKTKGLLMFGLLFGSLIIGNINTNKKQDIFHNWESIWCFIAVIIPIIILLIR